jgi:predicted protein tyrosine phosphatase
MRILFICSFNINRSRTAEDLFSDIHDTKSAGFHCETEGSQKQVDRSMIKWADIVFVFEDEHIYEIKHRFPAEYLTKRVINLQIPDAYNYGNEELVRTLRQKVPQYLK